LETVMKSIYKILTLQGKPFRPTASRAFPETHSLTHFFEDSRNPQEKR